MKIPQSLPRLPIAILVTGVMLLTQFCRAQPADSESSAARMRGTAIRFLESLSPEQRRTAVFAPDAPERRDWSNLPHTLHPRQGVALGDLTAEQRILAHHLIQAGLTSQGYLKANGIMQLDEVLLHLSGQASAEKPMFGLKYYWLSFLGEPASGQPWGWQLDGHHLALNFSLVGDRAAMTPQFLGADPHEVRQGAHAGWRVLGAEDDKGLALMKALTPDQSQKARIATEAPADVRTGPGKDRELPTPAGLAFAEMNDLQKGLLLALVDEYTRNYPPDLATPLLERINRSGWHQVRFAWAGPAGPSAPYYYRVQGPEILIEFDNNYPPGRRDGPVNHIHSVFRDPRNDYGEDLLKRHLEESHGAQRP